MREEYTMFYDAAKFATSTPNSSPVNLSETQSRALLIAQSSIGTENMNKSPQPDASPAESVYACSKCRTVNGSTDSRIQQLYFNESMKQKKPGPCGKDSLPHTSKIDRNGLDVALIVKGLSLARTQVSYLQKTVSVIKQTIEEIGQNQSSVREESLQFSCTDSAPIGSNSADQIHYYQNKLLSTMQILSNKDEMLTIQEESLKMAEVRMSTLTVRNTKLQAELDKKIHEVKVLRQELEIKSRTPPPQARNGSKTISKLQNNLSVIEKLYRDCFYESARQEVMVEMLRNSFLEVRLTDGEKSEEINRLQGVVVSQKWNLERCQDIAQELESLKSEIANVLNNSNHDSGMWERSEGSVQSDITQDLQEITQQLLQLKHILNECINKWSEGVKEAFIRPLRTDKSIDLLSTTSKPTARSVTARSSSSINQTNATKTNSICSHRCVTDCICGLQEENEKLKNENDTLNSQIADLSKRLDRLEIAVTDRNESIEHYKNQIKYHSAEIQQLAESLRESERCREELLKDKENLLKEKEDQCTDMSLLKTALQNVESSATVTRQRTQDTALEMSTARSSIDGLKDRLKSSKLQMKCKRSDMERLQALCQTHECTIKKLKEELNNAQVYLKENAKMRSDISYLTNQVKLWQTQLSEGSQKVKELEEQLATTQAAYEELQCSYRSKRESAVWLEHELAEASTRGAELCAESRHMVCGVRQWMQRMRQQHQYQESKIHELQRKLRMVKMKLAISQEGNQIGCVDLCYDPYMRTTKGCLESKRRSSEKTRCSLRRDFADAGSSCQGSDVQTSPTPPSSLDFTRQIRCTSCIQGQHLPKTQYEEETSPAEDLTSTMDNVGNDYHLHRKQFIKRMKIFKSGQD